MLAKKPTLHVSLTDLGKDRNADPVKALHQIEFRTVAESVVGIKFFSWDFAYKDGLFRPEILLDKTGVQVYKFKPGPHQIAVKVVDNDGLESIEIIKLNVNRKVEVR